MGKTNLNFKFFCKISVFVILFLCGATSVSAQATDGWKEKPVTLRVSNQPLGKVLEMVADAANAKITLQEVSLWNINKPISIAVKDKPLDKVLGDLVGDQNVAIRYEGEDQIILEPDKQVKSGEEIFVSGQVLDRDTQEALIGATILITDGKGESKGARGCFTDLDGKFSVRLNKKESVRISYVGYETVSKQILKNENNLVIELKPSIEMAEVVVTGISRRSKDSFTGNYVEVKGDDLRRMSPTNILKGLQFFDPSFKIIENNLAGSDPNAEPDFQIRGDQSLGTSSKNLNSMDLMLDNVSSRPNTPLFVLDGFIVPMSRILDLDPERVETITVLKDAAATSVYGSRAANGVVVVETKVAPDGALSVSYNGTMTVQTPDLTDYNMMDAATKLETEWRAGLYDPTNAAQMNLYNKYRRNVLGGVNTYWLSKPLRTAIQHRHSLSVAGGTDVFRYSLDINASMQPGVMKESSNNTKGVNFNMTYLKEKFTMRASVSLSESDGSNSPYGSFSQYTSLNSYYIPEDANGNQLKELDNNTVSGQSKLITNPLYNATVGIKDLTNSLSVTTNLSLEYMILKNLRVTEQLSYSRGMAGTDRFLPADHTNFAQYDDITRKGSYYKSTGEMSSWSSNFGINYNLVLDKHLFSIFGNWTINEDKNNYVNLSATGYPDAHMDDFIFGNKMETNMSNIGSENISRSIGLIGQFSYSYDNRYSVDFNISGEASSRYANHELVPFWSVGGRWNAHNEKWLQGYVSNLVLRASYGVTGEQNFSPSDAIEYYAFSDKTMLPYNSFPVLGAMLSGLNNTNLGWAKTHNRSVSLDFGFWKNRVNITLNYYNNITKELLTNYDLAPSTGYSTMVMNAGELQNQGFDVTLNVVAVQNLRKQFFWTVSANANANRNKILELSEFLKKENEKQMASANAPLPEYREGESTTTLYVVRSLGVDPVTGKEVYLKRDGTKTFDWSPNDKVAVGDMNPKISGTLSTSINWKDLSCTLGFTYKYGGVVYNQTLVDKIENQNVAYNLDNRAGQGRWERPGDVTPYVRFNPTGANTPASTRFIMDDNEIRFATMNIGYRFTGDSYKFLRRANIDVMALNFTTNDLARISPIKMERGLDYPFARSYTLSLSIMFR
ncbi:MAG: SusC/RagA family TonB-linked outer membrane protein [Bacteroidaceae bacterium]|nr:SusC/RagA family TonB-linked outer membrane protein [Bacteroidaceae bacterium]